jgi:hypothetical protein
MTKSKPKTSRDTTITLALANPSERATHLEVSVSYDKGGPNYFSGSTVARGYYLSVGPVKLARGMRRFEIMSHRAVLLETTGRRSDKRLGWHFEQAKASVTAQSGQAFELLQRFRAAEAAKEGDRRRVYHVCWDAPFIKIDHCWCSESAVALAKVVTAGGADKAPLLADALEEAGCDCPLTLAELRRPDDEVARRAGEPGVALVVARHVLSHQASY